ncbi:Gfo/Idh/MocA family protein [Halalkalibacter alkaliphilus]|uniref:Gfo/Idh/MocA family oxidoreductase n=1 Tax=Halalkalibacter alkaliphilus TaxID=2917993 RepID=A0A9X2I699_9BACI|nr:Gfo/Idh/MocA family oxidoreductase [Halalkalibacter alkaliphilus]MCL7748493.1 Gfo/Idh/MocA family oxidoreductase [Halalkalibacter alkaliphilus]
MDVRIGLVGAGWMGKAHTNAFINALMAFGPEAGKPVFEVVSDVSESAAKAASEQLGYLRYTIDWKEVVTDERVDVVDIATPNAFHYEIAKAALENGKHIYCEKPLTLSAVQSEELAELAKQKGVVNYVGYNNVMNPANAYIKELVDSGKLGKIVKFTGTYDQDGLLDESLPITWRHINKFSGSGSLGDLGSHLLSVSQYILGNIESVNALSKIVIEERPVSTGSTELAKVENDDVISILANYENGALGMISSSRIAAGRKNYLTYEIQGTKGTVYYSLERMNEVNVYFTSDHAADRGFRQVFLSPEHKGYSAFYPAAGIAIGYNDMKVLEAHELLSAVSNGTPYVCDFAFGASIDKTVDAILKSAEEKNWVDVSEKGGVTV